MLLTSQREIGNKNKVRIYLENLCPAKQQPWCCTLKENGNPASPMEMVWVLVNQYKWKITLTNSSGNGTETYQ